MNLDALWAELAAAPESDSSTGRRRIYADSGIDLNLTLAPRGLRGLALTVNSSAAVDIETLPSTAAIEHTLRPAAVADHSVLELRLVDHGAVDIFGALASDVAAAAARAANDQRAVANWINRITRWQKLLARGASGLGPERQRGLYGELHFLATHLLPRVGALTTVLGWEGPVGGHDFQLSGGAYEIKTAASNEPQVVTINGERQLDETGTDGLHLVHLSIDVHRNSSETLPDLVAFIRDELDGTAAASEFEDRLLEVGYSDVHVDRYQHLGYTVREENFFAIGDGFPRIIESELPDGVGGLRYRLVIAACMPFSVTAVQALAGLEESADAR